MEKSPIVLAHNHARSALLETRRSNPVAASEEHDLAATEFATAAKDTSDSEAHRILLLLEDHHKKLGQILRSRHENASHYAQLHTTSTSSLPPIQSRSAEAAATAISSPPRTSSPETPNPTIPKLSQNVRSLQREGSSSLASNLASARGIPGSQQRRGSPASPTLSAQHVGGKMASGPKPLEGQTRDVANNASSKDSATLDSLRPARDVDQDTVVPVESQPQEATTSDAPFQQFYNTFESLISKISAPLAFAGLPLTSSTDTTPPTDTKHTKPPHPSTRQQPPLGTAKPDNPSTEIDYSTLISRAALRAVRDGPSNHPSVAESFYVVPTTGGTVSYAGILNREASDQSGRHHGRQLSNISETTVDDFVDARETIPPGSPELTRLDAPAPPLLQSIGPLRRSRHSTTDSGSNSGSATQTAKPFKHPPDTQIVGGKTPEELHLENTALKHLSDTLSKRLHMWETTSQNQGAALHQSIRLQLSQQQSSPTASLASPPAANVARRGASEATTTTPAATEEEKKRVEELEEMLRKLEKEKGRQDRENEKLRSVVGRYRERWERLKEGAKSRREGATGMGTNAGGTGDGRGSGEVDGGLGRE